MICYQQFYILWYFRNYFTLLTMNYEEKIVGQTVNQRGIPSGTNTFFPLVSIQPGEILYTFLVSRSDIITYMRTNDKKAVLSVVEAINLHSKYVSP